jgi:DNA replication and repair protein RecF
MGNGQTLLFGENGSGKTSVLESIFLLGFGKSFLNVRRRELVRQGAEGFFIRGELTNDYGSCTIEASMGDGFRFRLNGEKATILDISDYLYPVFFSSAQYGLYIESRQLQRKLVDRFTFGVQPLYLHYILRYNHALKQKNSLLRKAYFPLNPIELDSWNRVMAESGAHVIRERMNFVDRLNKVISDTYDPRLRLCYTPSIRSDDDFSADALLRELQTYREREIRARQSLAGPQRDAFEIMLGERKLSLFSSGEKKKYLLLVYFAFIELYRQQRQQTPLLLVDDYDAAVDDHNLDYLFSHFPDIQIIATSVHADTRFPRRIELHKEN